MPQFYKLEKVTYTRADISEIGHKLGRKLDDLEHLVEYERRKNLATQREKVGLQQQVNSLVMQQQKETQERAWVKEQAARQTAVISKLGECLGALKDSMIYNYLVLDFYKEV